MKITTLLAVVLAAFPVVSFGQTDIVQTQSFSGIPDFSSPLLFNKYAGNAADIVGIKISYSLTIQGGQFVIDNDADSPANVTASFGAELDATSSTVPLLTSGYHQIINGVGVINSATYSLAANQGDGLNDYDGTGPDGAILVGKTKTNSGDGQVGSIFFGDYAGGGTFIVDAKSRQVASFGSSSGIETATTPVHANGFVTITYTVVPEPSSFALFGLGALGFVLRRRRA